MTVAARIGFVNESQICESSTNPIRAATVMERFHGRESMRVLIALVGLISIASAQTDWPVYGHDPGGMRYSPLKRITTKNVANLKVAWTYDTQVPAAAPPSGIPSNEA